MLWMHSGKRWEIFRLRSWVLLPGGVLRLMAWSGEWWPNGKTNMTGAWRIIWLSWQKWSKYGSQKIYRSHRGGWFYRQFAYLVFPSAGGSDSYPCVLLWGSRV